MVGRRDRFAIEFFAISAPGMIGRWDIGGLFKRFGRNDFSLLGLAVELLGLDPGDLRNRRAHSEDRAPVVCGVNLDKRHVPRGGGEETGAVRLTLD